MAEIEHPSWYNWFPIECMTVARHFPFHLGNALKYIWRAGRKPGAPTVDDLRKAIYCIEQEIQRLESGPETVVEDVKGFDPEDAQDRYVVPAPVKRPHRSPGQPFPRRPRPRGPYRPRRYRRWCSRAAVKAGRDS